MALTVKLEHSTEQVVFDPKHWAEGLADPELAGLPHRIEMDRHCHILLSPPPAPAHGDRESKIAFQLKILLPHARTENVRFPPQTG